MPLTATKTPPTAVPSRSKWEAKAIRQTSTRWSRAWTFGGKKLKFLRKIPIDPMTGNGGVGHAFHAGRSYFRLLGRSETYSTSTASRKAPPWTTTKYKDW